MRHALSAQIIIELGKVKPQHGIGDIDAEDEARGEEAKPQRKPQGRELEVEVPLRQASRGTQRGPYPKALVYTQARSKAEAQEKVGTRHKHEAAPY